MRAGVWLSSGDGGLEDVEDGEEEDPDDINEVPIEADVIKRGGAPGPVVAREELAEKAPENQKDSDKHVGAVKAGHHEKAGAVNPVFVKPKSFVVEVIPLPSLHGKED